MVTPFRRLFIAMALSCSASAALGASTDDKAVLDRDRLQLAEFLARQDLVNAYPLISDPWSGLRFSSDWPPQQWRTVAEALRQATFLSRRTDTADFETRWPPSSTQSDAVRRFHFVLRDGRWLLDWNSLLGPFPHR